jgi:hypothetical protein
MLLIPLLIVLAGLVFFFSEDGLWYPVTRTVDFADLDGDGDPDAVIGNGHTDDTGAYNWVWFNDGSGHFKNSGQQLGKSYEDTQVIVFADVNMDGAVDIVFGGESTPSIWHNDGAGNFSQGYRISNWESETQMGWAYALASGDLDGDKDLDLFYGACCRFHWMSFSGEDEQVQDEGFFDSVDRILINNGSGNFQYTPQELFNNSTGAVALGDLDGDSDLDAFVANRRADPENMLGDPADMVWLNDGSGKMTDSGQRLGESNGIAVALSDLDNDGDLDAFVGNTGYEGPNLGAPNTVWLNDGSANFTESRSVGAGETISIALGDLDGDSDPDAFLHHRNFSQVMWNDGSAHFSEGPFFNHGRGYAANIGDLDGDGDLDMLAVHYTKGSQLWLNNGKGIFKQTR